VTRKGHLQCDRTAKISVKLSKEYRKINKTSMADEQYFFKFAFFRP